MPELRWEGKYDADARRVAPVRVALPFQTVETVNESAQERQRTLDFFSEGRDPGWRNRLVWGDKKYVLPALLDEFAGAIDLVYIDPPFATGADFSFRVRVGDGEFMKEPNVIEQKAYRDTWGHGLDSYLKWFYESVVLIRDLLKETGAIYVHIGPDMSAYVRCILDEVFGADCRLNEIIWKRTPFAGSSKARANKFPVNHDSIFYYAARPSGYKFQHAYEDYSLEYKARFKYQDERGFYRKTLLKTYSQITERRLKSEDRWIEPRRAGAYPSYKQYLHESKGRQIEDIWSEDTVWEDVNLANPMAAERTGYATQKPEALLTRIITASSRPGDLVADFFCGSGTTPAVAEKLGRRWIAADLGRFAIHTARKRLLALPGVKPFVVQNLGKYERQAWQAAEFGSTPEGLSLRYRHFILQLFRATAMTGYNWIHGMKAGRAVHVGAVDAPVSPGDVQQMVVELAKLRSSSGTGGPKAIDVLGWDFAFELNELAKQQAARAGIDLRFFRIPHDVMDKRAVAQGDISFFELAALSVKLGKKGRIATVTLTDFVIPLDDVPEDIQKVVRDWSEWIDYWAIDWDNREDTFHNVWQSYRSRATPKLERAATHEYDAPGQYTIVVKVIDILGNDTTKTLSVDVK